MIQVFYKYLFTFFLTLLVEVSGYGQALKSNSQPGDSVGVYLDENGNRKFICKSSIWITRDTERALPLTFEVTLPETQVHWSIAGSSELALNFPRKQVMLIFTPVFEPTFGTRDTVYVPSNDELDNLVHDIFYPTGPRRHDVTKIPIKRNRNNLIINRGAVRIVLFNVLPKNFENYLRSTESLVLRNQ